MVIMVLLFTHAESQESDDGALSRTQIWDTKIPMISNTSGVPVLHSGRRR
eukprot:SAG31_NODE_67_length_28318_cov_6.493674_22_plen_50_part_00